MDQAWESHGPVVHGINYIAAIQLEEQPMLNAEATGFQIGPTKSGRLEVKGYRDVIVGTKISLVIGEAD